MEGSKVIVNNRKEHILFIVDGNDNLFPMIQSSFRSAHELGHSMMFEYLWVKEIYITQMWLRSTLDMQFAKDCAIFSMVRA